MLLSAISGLFPASFLFAIPMFVDQIKMDWIWLNGLIKTKMMVDFSCSILQHICMSDDLIPTSSGWKICSIMINWFKFKSSFWNYSLVYILIFAYRSSYRWVSDLKVPSIDSVNSSAQLSYDSPMDWMIKSWNYNEAIMDDHGWSNHQNHSRI